MKYLIVLALILGGCINSTQSSTSGTKEFDIICIDNVEYFYNDDSIAYKGWLTPHLKIDGKPYLCEE